MNIKQKIRVLTEQELASLREDMIKASALMKAELVRRKAQHSIICIQQGKNQ
ncbi:hypothetical protein [Aeromonas veronii]|uniref:hypothetical protein n=1 Tax=Aeromonas veronii TaxID=654 RepID=UPI000A7C54CD|nr:hypothetical protein [Aeromonas veronii]